MSIATSPTIVPGSGVTLQQVGWDIYERLRSNDANRGVRMVYDHGVLHLVSPSRRHERIAEILNRLVLAWTEERDLSCLSGGSTTMKSALLDRGLDPDKCYYIQNEAAVRGRDEYDPEVDPPPDLAIEVDVTSLSAAKLPIYAAFQVPEVWRWIDDRLEFYRLNGDEYTIVDGSTCLLEFPAAAAVGLIKRRQEFSETELVREFRQRIADSTQGSD